MTLPDGKNNVHYLTPKSALENDAMVKEVKFGYAELSAILSYDPASGSFTWLVMTSPKALAGSSAGAWVNGANGKKYLSITYRGRKMSASQVAWCLSYKEWPERSIHFIDENPANLRLSNLKKADYTSVKFTNSKGITRYVMSKEQVRHYGLVKNYNVTMTQYAEMFAAQKGCCAICARPETARLPGRKTDSTDSRTRDLSVDHDHETGAVRQLLCNACNHMLGHAGDSADRLRAAAHYVDFHRKALKNVS